MASNVENVSIWWRHHDKRWSGVKTWQWKPDRSFTPARVTYQSLVTHICVKNKPIIGWDNGMSPVCYQAIVWTNAGWLIVGPMEFAELCKQYFVYIFRIEKYIKEPAGKYLHDTVSYIIFLILLLMCTIYRSDEMKDHLFTGLEWLVLFWVLGLTARFGKMTYYRRNNICSTQVLFSIHSNWQVGVVLLYTIVTSSHRHFLHCRPFVRALMYSLIAWGPSGADRTQVGPILAPWTLLYGLNPFQVAGNAEA